MALGDLEIIYYLDEKNTIIRTENIDDKGILGRGYFEFSNDEMLKRLLSKIFDKVRTLNKPFTTTYRCDDEVDLRIFKLTIEPMGNGFIKLKHELFKKEPRIKALDFSQRSDIIYRMCAWCDKIFYNDQYIELDDAINKMKIFEHNFLPLFTHGICNDCQKKLLEEIEEFSNEPNSS